MIRLIIHDFVTLELLFQGFAFGAGASSGGSTGFSFGSPAPNAAPFGSSTSAGTSTPLGFVY
jgi:hypothetical protein